MKKVKKVENNIVEKELQEYYILKIGETLEDVAKKFNVNVDKLKELNGEVFGTNQIRMK